VVSTAIIAFAIIASVTTFSSSSFVFFEFNNQSGFESPVYTSMIGILTALYGFSGYDSGATLAEETKDASRSAPIAIIYSIVLSAVTGLIFILSLLYACGDSLSTALSGSSDQAIVNIFNNTFTDSNQQPN
jgi:choline transport protein